MTTNMSFDYPYVRRFHEIMTKYYKDNPQWESMTGLHPPNKSIGNVGMKGGGSSLVVGPTSKGFNEYLKFQHFYEKTPKAYKSSGNYNPVYLHQNELDVINKENFPNINYEKNKYNNSNKDMDRSQVKINESIKRAVKKDFDTTLLKGGALSKKLRGNNRKVHDEVCKVCHKMGYYNRPDMKEEDLDGGKFKSVLKKGLQKAVPMGIKLAVPALSGAVAQTIGVPAPVGALLGKIAADVIAEKVSKKIGKGKVQPKPLGSNIEAMLKRDIKRAVKKSLQGRGNQKVLDNDKFQKSLNFGKKLMKELLKESAKLGVKKGIQYALPYVARQVATEFNIDARFAQDIAKIVGDMIAGELDPHQREKDVALELAKAEAIKESLSGRGKAFSKHEQILHDQILKTFKGMQGGFMTKGGKLKTKLFKEALHKASPVLKEVAPHIAKHGIPLLASVVGDALHLPKPVSNVLGKAVSSVVTKELSSKDKKKEEDKGGVGVYKGGSNKMSRQKRRGQLVSKLMKEHGISLKDASKMIKEKKMDY